MEAGPDLLEQELFQAQLIGLVQLALPMQTRGHQLGDLAVLDHRHADHGELLHGRVVLIAIEGGRVLADLQADEDQRKRDRKPRHDLRDVEHGFKRHLTRLPRTFRVDRSSAVRRRRLAGRRVMSQFEMESGSNPPQADGCSDHVTWALFSARPLAIGFLRVSERAFNLAQLGTQVSNHGATVDELPALAD